MSFRHIYFRDYQIDVSYQRRNGNQIINLGILVAKRTVGAPQDPDMELTFKRPDNTTYTHIVDFGPHYRVAPDQGGAGAASGAGAANPPSSVAQCAGSAGNGGTASQA